MGDVGWVSQLVGRAYGVEESYGLVCGRANKKLSLLKVADIHNRGVVGIETFVHWDVPGWVSLEQLDQVSLNVPNDYLRLEGA